MSNRTFILIVLAGVFAAPHLAAADPLTADAANQTWNDRSSPTSHGSTLWTDDADVFFHDGSITVLVQAFAAGIPELRFISSSRP